VTDEEKQQYEKLKELIATFERGDSLFVELRSDIAKLLGLKFDGPTIEVGSTGAFAEPTLITQPSKCPPWAKEGSVEDFWQSNKWLQVRA
jgi:hypothetical protein